MENNENKGGKVTEEQSIGFRRRPTTLAETLKEKGFSPFEFKRKAGREPGSRYRAMTRHGNMYVLYQDGEQMNPHYQPARDDGDIAALVRVEITTGIISGSRDKPLIDARDSLVEHLLETYSSAGAFFYVPNPASRRETA
jgi:hypothetical protein